MEENPELFKEVEKENGLKQLVVDYIGDSLNLDPDKDGVTVEMAIEVFAKEFPEILLVVSEENFIRGYRQAMTDLESSSGTVHKKDG